MGLDASIYKFEKIYNVYDKRIDFVDFLNNTDNEDMFTNMQEGFYITNRYVNNIIMCCIKEVTGDNYCEESASIITKEVLKRSLKRINNNVNYKIYADKIEKQIKIMNEEKYDYLYHVTY